MTLPEWGDKGCVYRPDKCEHAPDDGCEWCCMICNVDRHYCPGCGTVSDHKNTPCDDCEKQIQTVSDFYESYEQAFGHDHG